MISVMAMPIILGCQQDEIRSYDAPKPPAVDKVKERMLAALVPHGEQMWVLKLQGPEALVAAHKKEFESVLESLHFTDQPGKPITWKTPSGWKDEPGDRMRFATLRLEADDKVELAISELPASDLLANVNRWRGQLALPPVEQADLPKVTSTVKVDGANAAVVDFTGTSHGKKMRPFAGRSLVPPFAGSSEGNVAEKLPQGLKYTTPTGWNEEPAPQLPRIASFKIIEGSQSADVAVTNFPGDVGGMAANVDLWRKQVGLGPADAVQLKKDAHELEVGGEKAYYVDLTGSAQNRSAQRMLGVGLPHGDSTWFFKMTGSAELVGKHKAAFETFVTSVKFDGGKGANP